MDLLGGECEHEGDNRGHILTHVYGSVPDRDGKTAVSRVRSTGADYITRCERGIAADPEGRTIILCSSAVRPDVGLLAVGSSRKSRCIHILAKGSDAGE